MESWKAGFHKSDVPGLLSHCAGCFVVRCLSMDYIQCANWPTARVHDEYGYLSERQNQQKWGAKESWAAISEIHSDIQIYRYTDIQMNLLWLDHMERIHHERLLRQILYPQLQEGKWNQGRLRLRFKETVKRNMKKMDIEKGTGKRRQKVEKAEGISLDLIVAPTHCWWWRALFLVLAT